MTEAGSESPRSIRSYHKGGSGSLTGGGVHKIYSSNPVEMKAYKRKLDSRLGQCLLVVMASLATLLAIYGFMQNSIHQPIYSYVNRTHQIVYELENAVNENYAGLKAASDNETKTEKQREEAERDPKWLTAEELEDYSRLLTKTRSTLWGLFLGNVLLSFVLIIVLCVVRLEFAEGTYVKLAYRVVLVVCLLFLVAQFLYMIYPLLRAAFSFPSMIDRLFVDGHPRDEYQRRAIEDSLSCQFDANPHLVQFDLQMPCVSRLKNSLLPVYGVLLMMLMNVVPFAFSAFTYAWSACIKDHKHVQTARQRVQLNNQRRVPIPKMQPRDGFMPQSPPSSRAENNFV